MNYSEYFEDRVCHKTNKEFFGLSDRAPQVLKDFIWSVHEKVFDDSMPFVSDWTLKVIRDEFEAMEFEELKDCSIEEDVTAFDLIEWLKEPGASRICNEGIEFGLTDGKDIMETIRTGNLMAKFAIWKLMNDFMNEQKRSPE